MFAMRRGHGTFDSFRPASTSATSGAFNGDATTPARSTAVALFRVPRKLARRAGRGGVRPRTSQIQDVPRGREACLEWWTTVGFVREWMVALRIATS